MKLIYQHMVSFLIVILMTVSIIGYYEINYITDQTYSQNYKRLDDYAISLGHLALANPGSADEFSASFLDRLQFIMKSDDISIKIFNADNVQVYPETDEIVSLPQSVFSVLRHGKKIRIKNNNQDPANLKQTKDAYTGMFVPWIRRDRLYGAIWIGSRVKNVERSITLAKANLFKALIVTLLVGVIISFILAYYSTSKIKRMSKATQKVAAGDFSVQLEHDGKDEIDQLAGNFNDMVQALKKSNEEIKKQEKQRDQFMADAAHEMRTPLTTINGILEGLQYDAIPEDAKPKSIALMQRETKRLIRLVNENLDYEKIRSNQIMLTKTKFNASPIISDIQTQLGQNAAKLQDKLQAEVPENLPIYADQDRFTQILVNLVQNAIQFTDNGTIIVKGWREDHATCISVTDNGIGMSPQQTKYIFERFFKVDPSRARLGTGESGLGLAIVSSLIKQHGGKIEVESQLTVGSTFTITIYDQGFEQFITEGK